ncbi:macrodomain Ter protein MatP [Thaumasiovibrio sp. DFM-14]|uniref:macrodomain Ter protein MatP n=1 Tax=Thaumasiovibrio sp. DFM-14 TaxID=3384792 RepID=UPI0039A2A68E
MKYQQLENLEAGWKWTYLVKKHRDGEHITRYIDTSEDQAAVETLLSLEHEPTHVLDWIDTHISTDIENKLKQAIRAKRKRHFNAEQEHTRKKSIDLDYKVWKMLADKSTELGSTLSETIEYLITESNRASKRVVDIKNDLHELLKMDEE